MATASVFGQDRKMRPFLPVIFIALALLLAPAPVQAQAPDPLATAQAARATTAHVTN